MWYLVDGKIKRRTEVIVDLNRYDPSGVYALVLYRFSDGDIAWEDYCFELSFTNIKYSIFSWLRMQRTKLLLKFNSLVSKKTSQSDSVF